MNINNKNYYLIKYDDNNKNDISSSIKDSMISQKLISIKDNKNKNIFERNGNKLNICFITPSTNNINKNTSISNNIQLIKKRFLKQKKNI